MGAYIVEGRITQAEVKWARRGKTYFKKLSFQTANGDIEAPGKVIATNVLATELAVDVRGRFYLFKSMGVTGLYGIRFADGREVQEYPGDQSIIFAFIAIVWIALNMLYITTKDQVSILGLILTPLGIFGWWWCRKIRGEVERLWQEDSGENRIARVRDDASTGSI
jgi:hypothetical protein